MQSRTRLNQRFARSRGAISVALLAMIVVVADSQGWLLARRSDDFGVYHGRRAHVQKIIDGDTLEVDLADAMNARAMTRVRLWGVDCPEPARAGMPAEPLAQQASALAQQHALGQSVTLWLEPHQPRDAFGRVLAHVELPDGKRLNELLLEQGMAVVDERWAHTYLTRYAQAENQARRRGLGVWSR